MIVDPEILQSHKFILLAALRRIASQSTDPYARTIARQTIRDIEREEARLCA